MTSAEQMISEAIRRRQAAGFTVETTADGERFTRHCVDAADRDAYIARCEARGEAVRVL